MRNLIIYSTRKGTTFELAKRLAEKLKGKTELVNIKSKPELGGYDTIILGGAIIAGKISNGMYQFCEKNLIELKKKKTGLFVCCLDDKELESYFKKSFPAELIEHSIVRENFGGSCNLEKENFIMKKLLKIMGSKTGEFYINENIDKLAAKINEEE